MSLPTAVQRQADSADSIEKQLTGEADAAPEAAKAEGPGAERVTEETGNAETVQEQPAEDEVEKLKRRYSSLRGKYDVEVPRLMQRNQELEARLKQVLDENEKLHEDAAQQQEQEVGITEDDEDAYGAEVVGLVRRGIRKETAKLQAEIERLKQLNQRQQDQVARVESDTVAARDSEFVRTMTALLPDWQLQNEDKDFIAWLQETDPVYGFVRQKLLTDAAHNYDAHRVATIFKQYRDQKADASAKSPLARQVTPTHTAGSTPQGGGNQAWTPETIAQFYEDCRHGRYTDEQAEKIEKEIDSAVASGQVKY